VWLAGPDGDPDVRAALADLVAADPDAVVEIVPGSWDPPGARLLDVVAVMDRLRSPGGCPWDAEQTHRTLAPYLLEESYELLEAIEGDDLVHLREELGDVLLQVAFHARLAEERSEPERWSIDDVAADLVAKLVRRHPHVFAERAVTGAAEVAANWEDIKRAEKRRESVTDGVPLGQPALALAAKLRRRADKAALEVAEPAGDDLGARLFALVGEAVAAGVDPEAALRSTARAYRDAVRGAEAVARSDG
jgi:XTP/dITP diphosphohydrolase